MSLASAYSGGSGGKKGGNWTYKIYFSPEAESGSEVHEIEDEELIEKLKQLVDVDEIIEEIWAYKHNLFSWQRNTGILYHLFITFRTKHWWWSIEKNTEGLTIQRSKDIKFVRDMYRQKSRPTMTLEELDSGCKSMLDLIEWLSKENELNKEYNVLSSNCQTFGAAVFNYVATGKRI